MRWLIAIPLLYGVLARVHADVRINEVVLLNDGTFTNTNGKSYPWLEIYNNADTPADITGWHLSDRLAKPKKWAFPETALPPKARLVVFLSGEGKDTMPSGELHTNFKLSIKDPLISISDAHGKIRQRLVIPSSVPLGYSFGPSKKQDAWTYHLPTPGKPHQSSFDGIVTEPQPSVRRGFYNEDIAVLLTCNTPHSAIYYTLDGSLPSKSSSLYTTPVVITKATNTTLRARAFRSNYVPSDTITHTLWRSRKLTHFCSPKLSHQEKSSFFSK